MNTHLSLIKQLIKIPSEAENRTACDEILSLVKNELADFPHKQFQSNGIKSLLFTNTHQHESHFKLILNAHVDVVPGSKEQYEPVEKDGKLYGRGAYDMKSSAAIMVHVFKDLAKQLPYPLGLQIVTDEEMGGTNGTNYQIQQGITAEFVLGGENSAMKINNEAKGVIVLKLHVTGKSNHSSKPWAADNAIDHMIQILDTLAKIFPHPKQEAWETTLSVINIATDNTTLNSIPDNCTALINIRYIPEENRDLLELIRKSVPSNTEVETILEFSPEFAEQDNPFVKKLANSITIVTNHPAEYLKTHGQSDLRYYHTINTPGVNFSPLGGNHHTNNEWVDLESLEDYDAILKHFLLSL